MRLMLNLIENLKRTEFGKKGGGAKHILVSLVNYGYHH